VNFEESSGFIAPLQLKRFNVGSKMAIAASAPVLPNQKKNSVAKSLDSLTHPLVGRLVHATVVTVFMIQFQFLPRGLQPT
jgi:hypothetical protein